MDEGTIKEVLGWVPPEGGANFRKVRMGSKDYLQIFIPVGGFPAYAWIPLQGRPDMSRPHGEETFLGYLRSRLEEFKRRKGTDEGFMLAEEDVNECGKEILDFYRRRRFLLEDAAIAGEFEVVVNDGQHSLELMNMLERYCADKDRVWAHRQYEPYIRSHIVQAKALLHLQKGDYRGMVAAVKKGIREIEDFDQGHGQWEYGDVHESVLPRNLIRYLAEMTIKLLGESLKRAVKEEDYETAAVIRDLKAEFEKDS